MYRISLAMILLVCAVWRTGAAQNMTFDILGGEDKIEVPFLFVHNFIVVEVRLFGMIPMNFIFDTGAENTILLTKEFSDYIGVQYDLRIPLLGSDMSKQVYALVARDIEVELIGLPSQQRDILVLEENHFNLTEMTGVQIHGLLGGSFFKNSVVEIDYRKQKLIFYDPGAFEAPGPSFRQREIIVDHNKPYLNALTTLSSGETTELKLLIDTGAGLPLLLNNDSHSSLVLPDNYIYAQLGVGLGGYIRGYVGRVKSIELASIRFDDVLTSFQEVETTVSPDTIWSRNGLLGNQLLLRMRVVIDYVNETVYFKPRYRHQRKFKMDRSGLLIAATGLSLNEFVVRGTIPGSPAEKAGILPGDKIKRLQGLPARGYSLDQITRVMQKKVGKRIRLVITRGGEDIRVEFRLQQLI